MNCSRDISHAVLVLVVTCFSVTAQSLKSVEGVRDKTAIPPACESIVPANLEDKIDIKALVKEWNCNGSGDMYLDYSYVLTSVKREQGNKRQVKEESIVYEVFMPVLPSGKRGPWRLAGYPPGWCAGTATGAGKRTSASRRASRKRREESCLDSDIADANSREP